MPVNQTFYTAADLDQAYHRGIADERERAAAAGHEADLSWRRTAEEIYRDRKAEMLRLFEKCAHEFHERELGRPYVPFKGVSA